MLARPIALNAGSQSTGPRPFPGSQKTTTFVGWSFPRGFGEATQAIRFEKQLKRWRREWRVRLIEQDNLEWADLYVEMMALPPLHPDLLGIEINPNL